MSSADRVETARAPLRAGLLALALSAQLILSGCLQPLYGPTASGAGLEQVLASIEVAEVVASDNRQEMSHHLRSELVFALDGSGTNAVARNATLAVTVRDSLSTPVVNTATGRADSVIINGVANYRLTSLDGTRVIAQGEVDASVAYDRSVQRFATLRAQRDAELRLARLLSEQIRDRLALALRTGAASL